MFCVTATEFGLCLIFFLCGWGWKCKCEGIFFYVTFFFIVNVFTFCTIVALIFVFYVLFSNMLVVYCKNDDVVPMKLSVHSNRVPTHNRKTSKKLTESQKKRRKPKLLTFLIIDFGLIPLNTTLFLDSKSSLFLNYSNIDLYCSVILFFFLSNQISNRKILPK